MTGILQLHAVDKPSGSCTFVLFEGFCSRSIHWSAKGMRDGARDELSRYLAFSSREKGVVEKRRGMENQTVVGSIGIKRIGMINAV